MDSTNFEQAKYYIDLGLAKYPDSLVFHVQSGVVNRYLENYQESLTAYSKANEISNNNPDVIRGRGRTRLAMKDSVGAVEDYKYYLKLLPEDALGHLVLANLQYDMGDYTAAKNHYLPYYDFDTSYLIHYERLIEIFYMESNLDSCLVILNELIEIHPHDNKALNVRVMVNGVLGHTDAQCFDLYTLMHLYDFNAMNRFDEQNCAELLKMGDPDSIYSFPLPPPEEIILEERIIKSEGE